MDESTTTKKVIIAVVLVVMIGGIGYYFYALRMRSTEVSPTPTYSSPLSDQGVDNFSATGNIVKNNPGMKPDVWYLVYDKTGAPASTVELIFTEKSRCMIGSYNGSCQKSLLVFGSRVEVTGFLNDSQVFVHSYKQIDLDQKG